jgi:hypothetical protein
MSSKIKSGLPAASVPLLIHPTLCGDSQIETFAKRRADESSKAGKSSDEDARNGAVLLCEFHESSLAPLRRTASSAKSAADSTDREVGMATVEAQCGLAAKR